jgi:hypothetical protein
MSEHSNASRPQVPICLSTAIKKSFLMVSLDIRVLPVFWSTGLERIHGDNLKGGNDERCDGR